MTASENLDCRSYEVLKYPAQYHMAKEQHGKKVRKLTTDEGALASLAEMGFEIPSIMTEYRKIGKLKGTYVDGILSRLTYANRLHTEFVPTLDKGQR